MSPALGQVPQHRQQPPLDAVERRDRLCRCEPLRATVDAFEQYGVDLGIAGQRDRAASIDDRDAALSRHRPEHLVPGQALRAGGRRRLDQIAGAQQLRASDVLQVDIAGQDTVEYQQAEAMRRRRGDRGYRGPVPGQASMDGDEQLDTRLGIAFRTDEPAEFRIQIQK